MIASNDLHVGSSPTEAPNVELLYCPKCNCSECGGVGYIRAATCWACVELTHTCLPFADQLLKPPPGGAKPYTAAEIRQLEQTIGRLWGAPNLMVGRLLATIKELQDKAWKFDSLAS